MTRFYLVLFSLLVQIGCAAHLPPPSPSNAGFDMLPAATAEEASGATIKIETARSLVVLAPGDADTYCALAVTTGQYEENGSALVSQGNAALAKSTMELYASPSELVVSGDRLDARDHRVPYVDVYTDNGRHGILCWYDLGDIRAIDGTYGVPR